MKIVGYHYQIILRITRFVTLVIRTDYQKFCLRSTPANATVVGPIRKLNRSNNCLLVCAGQRHPSHHPTDHRPITVKHFHDA